jgi:hypothetical protein
VSEMIFVFGSNLAGRHGAGAALHAKQHYGAKYGVGEGRTGNSYGIPTKDEQLNTRSLEDIKVSVDRFIEYATKHHEDGFYVTRIGCGLAGYKDADIAPMFSGAPENCMLPKVWCELYRGSNDCK